MGRKQQTKRKASTAARSSTVKRMAISRPPPRAATIAPFPIRQTRTITYCDSISLTPSAGNDVANYLFNANSINKPDKDNTGHQPYGHDTLETMYQYYSVRSAVIDITYFELGSDSSQYKPMMCGVYNLDQLGTISDPALIREQPGSVSKVLTDNDTVTIRGKYLRNNRFPAYAQNDSSAAFGASPSEQLFFNVFTAGNPTLTHDTNTTYAFIKIAYEVEMWEPKKLGSS